MRFYAPNVLWMYLPFWALLPVLWYFLESRAEKRFARFASPRLLAAILKGGDPARIRARRRLRFGLALAGLFFAIIALARPQMGVREEIVSSEGLDIAFVLDVSNSMLVEDIVPSRLKKAKHLIRSFVDRLSGDRAGIVAFAGSAYPAVPLTTDYEFLKQTLDILDENSIANQGSDLSKGLEVALGLLERGGVNDAKGEDSQRDNGSSRVIVVISDGEAHEGEEQKLVRRLKEAGVHVFTIGVGSAKGGPIPLRDQTGYMRGYKKDSGGTMILSKLETANLEGLAKATGGKYYGASSNEGEVEEILGRLSTMDRAQGEGRRVVVYDEVFQYPLGIGVLLLLLMLGMREASAGSGALTGLIRGLRKPISKPDRGAGIGLSLVAVAAVEALSATGAHAARTLGEYNETKKGIDAYADKDYTGAIQHFGKAQASNPDSGVHHLNLGDALFNAGSLEGAANEFQAVLNDKDPSLAAKGAFNLGKTYEQAKDFEKAIRAYQAGLERLLSHPDGDAETERRIKQALERAEQKKQQQQQQQQQDGQDGEGQGQSQGQGKDSQENKQAKNPQNQRYQIPKTKPQFKGEKLSEGDAKRILQQLQEQEKKSQQRVMRSRTGKPEKDRPLKDW